MKTQRGDGMFSFHPSLTFGRTSTAEFSAPRVGCTLPSRKFVDAPLCLRLSGPYGNWMQTKGIGRLKLSKDLTGNRSRLVAQCLSSNFTTADQYENTNTMSNLRLFTFRWCSIYASPLHFHTYQGFI